MLEFSGDPSWICLVLFLVSFGVGVGLENVENSPFKNGEICLTALTF